jgi:DNA-binding NarL/FixJ family response regulator
MTDITRNVTTADNTQPPLTITERAVLHRLAAGHTNARIGQHMGRSEKTVRNRPARVYVKLGVVNGAEAVVAHMRMEFARRDWRWPVCNGHRSKPW